MHHAVIEETSLMPAGAYAIGATRVVVLHRLRGPEVRLVLPQGFDPIPGEEGAPEVVGGHLCWLVAGEGYSPGLILAVRAAHPGVTWRRGREVRLTLRKGETALTAPVLGIRDGRLVAVIASGWFGRGWS